MDLSPEKCNVAMFYLQKSVMFVGFYLQKNVICHSAIVQDSIFGLPILYAASLPKTGIDIGYFPFLVSVITWLS